MTMKLSELITSLEIVKSYYDDPDGYHVGAEHDQIYLYVTDRPLSASHVQLMLDMGWFQEGGATEDDPSAYDPEESWMSFT